MATMGARVFVDTNVLLRAIIPRMSLHVAAETLIQRLWSDDVELWISRQVIREYLVQATHPNSFTPSLTVAQVMQQMEIIQTLFRIADETQEVTTQLIKLLQTHPVSGKQVHDTNLVATMLVYGIDTLATINVTDFNRFAGLIKLIRFSAEENG
jgi:predicted nucleic acid-binding protein